MKFPAVLTIFLLRTTLCNQLASPCGIKKYAIIDFNYHSPDYFTSSTLDFILANMSKLRNYHLDNYFLSDDVPLFIPAALAQIVAANVNATLIAKAEISEKFSKQNQSCFPRVLPLVYTHTEHRNVSYIWKKYFPGPKKLDKIYQIPGELPRFSYQKDDYLNFYHCDISKKLHISPWKFKLFTDPFDAWIWVNLLVDFGFVTAILFRQMEYEKRGEILLSMVASSMSLGTQVHSARMPIFILWMVMSMITVVFYSGSITSTLISPPEDDIVKTWEDLHKRGYSMLAAGKFFLNTTNNAIAAKSNKVAAPIRALLQNAVTYTSENMFEKFMFGDHVFDINFWPAALNIAEYYQDYIRKHAKSPGDMERVCNVGQELLFSTRNYFGFLPPGNEELFWVFQNIQEAGIVDRFTGEYYGMLISNRVQDRVRLKSRTKRISKETTSVENLKLQGKIITIFLLWVLCICGSFVFYFVEVMWYRTKQKGTLTTRISLE